MRFNSTDPDLETLIRRIDRNLIDLQPNFQRGEVWPRGKKQRLIDTILRGWHIPPIHLVDRGDGNFDVLDGQQRLTAIREFLAGEFAVDGHVDPVSSVMEQLHGKRWSALPQETREAFNNYTIRVFQLTDYQPEEPHELFFRLNQPTNLTEAEKRNAFIGAPRNQIKDLVARAADHGMNAETVGFTNTRMSYDEILARFVICLESHSISQKMTSARITERYRERRPFSPEVMKMAEDSLALVIQGARLAQDQHTIKPNKATLHTWLNVAAARVRDDSREEAEFACLMGYIEGARSVSRIALGDSQSELIKLIFRIFDDRATSRVLDVSSVLLRDYCVWAIAFLWLGPEAVPGRLRPKLEEILANSDFSQDEADSRLHERLVELDWGDRRWM